jgi:hypothetical protein
MITSSVTITSDEADGTFTPAFMPPSNPRQANFGYFTILIESGTWSATIVLQVSHDNGVSWEDVTDASWTAALYKVAFDPTIGVLYRLGCKNGGFTSGSVTCQLSK